MANVWNLIFDCVDQNVNKEKKKKKRAQRLHKCVEVFGLFFNGGFFKGKK